MSTEQPTAKKPKADEFSMKTGLGWKPQPILAEELTRQPPLEKCFIGVLKDKQSISKAIASFSTYLPCPQHLKRCSGLQIYLAPISKVDGKPENLKKFLVEKKFDLSLLEDDFKVVEVVAVAPKTKSQMSYATKFWPCNFHPDLNLEALISGSLFDEDQLASLEVCMKLAITVAEEAAVGSHECSGSALIVDPEEGSILSLAAASLDQHPMWHASMLAVDLIAKRQGGGAWALVKAEEQVRGDKRSFTSESPLRYPESLARIEVPKDGSLTFMKKDQKKIKKNMQEKCGPYLCTGYWAILLQEPCPLCAMALLHSRVSRIFYGTANPQCGILGSRAALHSVPGLNHRYQVWSGVIEEECFRALENRRSMVS